KLVIYLENLHNKIEAIKRAIGNEALLRIVYLKPNDEKTRRVVRPEMVGEMEYRGKRYVGMRAFCMERREERVFRIDRILEIEKVGKKRIDNEP
ncbi:WYL domain-containing protein, partial [Dehalococcoidia bacterium]|nr:WYL domain-containing protein [Dehalococcoidia bacterium]